MVSVFFLVDTSIFPTNPQSPLVKHPKRKEGKPFGHRVSTCVSWLPFRFLCPSLSGKATDVPTSVAEPTFWYQDLAAAETSISEAEAAFLEDLLGAHDGRGKNDPGSMSFRF